MINFDHSHLLVHDTHTHAFAFYNVYCIIYIDLNHYDHDDYHDLYDHHNQADSINTTQLQLQIYPPGATLRELCQPDLLAVPVARVINAL